MAWPITVSTLSYSVMTLVDTLLVSRLGAAELAGVGLGGIAAFVLLCFSFGLLRGAKTLVAQAVGAGKHGEVGAHLGAALGSAIAIGLLTLGLGQVLALAMPYLAASGPAGEAAATYLWIRILGAPMALVYVALREVRYAQGDARSPMVATVLANVVNIGLAYLFVFVLHKGVAGAAAATVIAHTVEAGVLVLAQHARGWGISATRREHVVALFRIGLPTGLQFTLEVGAFAMLAGLLSALSEVQMAAHQIALQVIHFSFLPAFAVGEAASVLAGQAVGANRDDLVIRVARQAMLVTAIYTGACTLVLAFGAPLVAGAFATDAVLAAVTIRLLHVAAVFQVFDAANVVARAVLRGTGDVRVPAVVGVLTSWALTPPLTWLLGYQLGLGARGGWLGLCAEIIVAAVILWWRLERLGWRPAAAEARARLARAADEDRRSGAQESVGPAEALPST
jgi:MATE family multidrug resistance protein